MSAVGVHTSRDTVDAKNGVTVKSIENDISWCVTEEGIGMQDVTQVELDMPRVISTSVTNRLHGDLRTSPTELHTRATYMYPKVLGCCQSRIWAILTSGEKFPNSTLRFPPGLAYWTPTHRPRASDAQTLHTFSNKLRIH